MFAKTASNEDVTFAAGIGSGDLVLDEYAVLRGREWLESWEKMTRTNIQATAKMNDIRVFLPGK